MALAKLIIGQGWVVGLLFFAIETEAHLLREVKEISRKKIRGGSNHLNFENSQRR